MMKKIISLFQRNYDGDRLVRDEVVPGAEWVLAGEGVATRKWDGTCCMIQHGEIYRRHDVKKGRAKPDGFIPAQSPDPTTGHWPGWVKCSADNPADRWHMEAFALYCDLLGGTYELVGPKINGNPEGFDTHTLIQHGVHTLSLGHYPPTFDGIRTFLRGCDIEGIVWHHADGRMVKIKGKDFGLKR